MNASICGMTGRFRWTTALIVVSLVCVLPTNAARVTREGVAKEWRLLKRDIAYAGKDCPIARGRRVPFTPDESECVERQALIWKTDRDPLDVALRRARALAEDLRGKPGFTARDAVDLLAQIEKDSSETEPTDEDARFAIFTRLLRVRERIAFANPLVKDIDKLLFIGREALPPDEYDYGTCLMDQFYGFHATQKDQSRGDGLYVLKNPFSDNPELVNLLKGKTIKSKSPFWNGRKLEAPWREMRWPAHPGGFLSPDVSWDGTEILFSWTSGWPLVRDWREETCFHIMKCKADGSDLEMLTWGDKNDLFPCWLPNGRVIFCSERRGGFGRCHLREGPSFTLHSMFPDGTDITCLSPHETNEFEPSVDNDGMVVYTRWDYVDRGWEQAHHPWITYPDGRDSREIFGNEHTDVNYGPLFVESIRAIPGSRKYVATACGHHALIRGSLFIFDPSLPDDRKFGPIKRLTPDQLFPESEWMNWPSRHSGAYGTAWPLSEDYYLCVYDGDANGQYSGHPFDGAETIDWRRRKYAVTLLDKWGNKVEVFSHAHISALDPMPLRARKRPPVIPHGTLTGRPAGPDGKRPEPLAEVPKVAEVALVNVMDSRYPFPEGTEIKELRIWQILPKLTPMDGTPRLGAIDQHPGRRCLGTVPVEADGSAFFEVPVNIPFYMQALDDEGCAVQTMRSVTYVHPGERLTCNGCHEPRERRAKRNVSKQPLAFVRKPSKIEPEVDGGRPWNYINTVQPVLDRNCTRCHDHGKPGFDPKTMPVFVKGDIEKAPFNFAISFRDIVEFGLIQLYTKAYTGERWWTKSVQRDDFTFPHSEPGKIGARGSKLYQVLKRGHHGVKLSPTEMRRIVLFLDSHGSYISHDYKPLEQCRGEVVEPVLE